MHRTTRWAVVVAGLLAGAALCVGSAARADDLLDEAREMADAAHHNAGVWASLCCKDELREMDLDLTRFETDQTAFNKATVTLDHAPIGSHTPCEYSSECAEDETCVPNPPEDDDDDSADSDDGDDGDEGEPGAGDDLADPDDGIGSDDENESGQATGDCESPAEVKADTLADTADNDFDDLRMAVGNVLDAHESFMKNLGVGVAVAVLVAFGGLAFFFVRRARRRAYAARAVGMPGGGPGGSVGPMQ
jgi:hypothetical protein